MNNLFVNIRLRSARILNKIAKILKLNEKHILYTIHGTQNYLKNSRTMRGGVMHMNSSNMGNRKKNPVFEAYLLAEKGRTERSAFN